MLQNESHSFPQSSRNHVATVEIQFPLFMQCITNNNVDLQPMKPLFRINRKNIIPHKDILVHYNINKPFMPNLALTLFLNFFPIVMDHQVLNLEQH